MSSNNDRRRSSGGGSYGMRILSGMRNRRSTLFGRAAAGTAHAWASMRAHSENPAHKARLAKEKQALKKNVKKFERDSSRYKIGKMKAAVSAVQSLLNVFAFIMSSVLIIYVLSNRNTFSGGVWVRRHLLADSTYVHTASTVRDVDGTPALQEFLKNTMMKVMFADNPGATSEMIQLDHTKNKELQQRCETHVGDFRKEDSYMTLRPMDRKGEVYLFDGVLIRQLRRAYGGPFDGFKRIKDDFRPAGYATDSFKASAAEGGGQANASLAVRSRFEYTDNRIPQEEFWGQLATYDVSEGFDVFLRAGMPFSEVTQSIDTIFNTSATPPWVDSNTVALVIMAKFYVPESPDEWRKYRGKTTKGPGISKTFGYAHQIYVRVLFEVMPLGVMRVFPEYLVVDSFWERDNVAIPFLAGLSGVVVLSFLIEIYQVCSTGGSTTEENQEKRRGCCVRFWFHGGPRRVLWWIIRNIHICSFAIALGYFVQFILAKRGVADPDEGDRTLDQAACSVSREVENQMWKFTFKTFVFAFAVYGCFMVTLMLKLLYLFPRMMTPIRAWTEGLEEMFITVLISTVPLMAAAVFFNCYMGDLHEFSTVVRSFFTMVLILAGDFDVEEIFADSSFNDPVPFGSMIIAAIRLFIVMAFTNIIIVVVLEKYTTAKQDVKDVHPHFDHAMTVGGLSVVRHCCCCLSQTAYEALEGKLERRLSRSKQDITIKEHEHHTDECDDYRKVTKKFIRYELMQLYNHLHEDATGGHPSTSSSPGTHDHDGGGGGVGSAPATAEAAGGGGGGEAALKRGKRSAVTPVGSSSSRGARPESPDLTEQDSSEIEVAQVSLGFDGKEDDIAARSLQLVRLS